MRLRSLLACAALLAALSLWTPSASADEFGSISLDSRTSAQQADYARDPAISGDGHYLAFDGSYGGRTGVWRKGLQSGEIEQVAGGDAQLPSISDDGRYISFTTTAGLVSIDQNGSPDVYVRDMSKQSSEAGAYTLASAIGGSSGEGGEEALSYANTGETAAFYGSIAAGRSALSANGREVAFVTTATSDLTGARPPAAPSTPALQVAVRNLDSKSTELVSVAYAAGSGTPVGREGGYGAVYTSGSIPSFSRTPSAYGGPGWLGASISADASTVAWMGQRIGAQVKLLSGESVEAQYAEPLWRRIADGPDAPTRRVTGGSDPASSSCASSAESKLPEEASESDPCQGPFATFKGGSKGVWNGGAGDSIPRLSGDGYKVAFLADAPLVSFGSSSYGAVNNGELYVADMHEGLTRVQALHQLTEPASSNFSELASTAPILDLGISPDASRVAFTTKRTEFQLSAPSYVSSPAAEPGLLELFDVDLSNETLTRATKGYEGGASEHPHPSEANSEGDPYTHAGDGALSPSYSHDGNTLAFSSTASNLVYGDGNTPALGSEVEPFDGSDAFSVSRTQASDTIAESSSSGAPASPSPTPPWRIAATAFPQPDGSVVLDVSTPGYGEASAEASASVLVRSGAVKVRKGAPARHPRTATRERVATRTVARAAATCAAEGLLPVKLRLSPAYRSLASRHGGLGATVSILFNEPGQVLLHATLTVTFQGAVTSHTKARVKAHSRHRRQRRQP